MYYVSASKLRGGVFSEAGVGLSTPGQKWCFLSVLTEEGLLIIAHSRTVVGDYKNLCGRRKFDPWQPLTP